jgi:hypothetical protein
MSEEDQAPRLPPQLARKFEELEKHRKKLLRDQAFARPEQLRMFVGTVLYPSITDLLENLAFGFMDAYGLAVSNANQLRRLHAWTADNLNQLGADLESGHMPGVSTEILDDFQQAFFALGVLLQKKLPNDKETESAYNQCAKMLSEMVRELMGDDYYEDGDGDDEGDEGDDEEEGSEDADESEEEAEEAGENEGESDGE